MSDFLINIRGDSTQFAGEAQKVLGKLNTMSSRAIMSAARGMLPFLTVGGATAFARNTMAWADQLRALSQRTQVNVETLQELDYTARQTGTSLTAFTDGVRDLARAQANAAAGQTKFIEAFDRFGVTVADLNTLNPEQLLRRIAGGMKNTELTSRQIADVMTLMGERASTLLPAMVQGLDTFAGAARNAGTVIKESIVDQLANANSEWDILMAQAKAQGVPWVRRVLMGIDFNKEFFGNLKQYFSRSPDARAGIMDRLIGLGLKWNIGGINDALPKPGSPPPAASTTIETAIKDLAAETRQTRDAQPSTDAMARAGLFTTSHQHLSIARRTLQLLQQSNIETRTQTAEIRALHRTMDNLL